MVDTDAVGLRTTTEIQSAESVEQWQHDLIGQATMILGTVVGEPPVRTPLPPEHPGEDTWEGPAEAATEVISEPEAGVVYLRELLKAIAANGLAMQALERQMWRGMTVAARIEEINAAP